MPDAKPWEHTEPGWYTHPIHGGVVLEEDGWWHYPLDESGPYGPYKTAKACIAALEPRPEGEE